MAAAVGPLTAGIRDARAADATVTIDTARTTAKLAPDSIGLSFEMRTVGEGDFEATKGNEAAIFTTLGVHNIRIGGNTVNYGTFWQPGGKPVPPWASIIITPADVERVAKFARAIDARVAWAVNYEHLDPVSIDNQVATVVTAFGANLHSIQCGNEPNLLFKSYAEFKVAFDGCKEAVGTKAKISGPDAVGGGRSWNAQFVIDEEKALNELNFHHYTGTKTVAALLDPATMSRSMADIRDARALAEAHGLSYRTDETNSQSRGGIAGVADVYASALWGMDYALATVQAGAGINFHGFLGVCGKPTVNGKNSYYTPICAATAADQSAKIMMAAPIFYGLWMANHLGPGQLHAVTVTGAANLSAYAVKGEDGPMRIALIEKTAPGGKLSVSISLGRGAGSGTARVIHMTGPSLTAQTGIQIQGAAVDRAGRLTPGPPDQVRYSDGSLTITLPTGSAALITLGRPSLHRPSATPH